jgi:hypothetical protein
VQVWLATDHSGDSDANSRVIYDVAGKVFGLVMELREGMLWYTGAYGSLAETVDSILAAPRLGAARQPTSHDGVVVVVQHSSPLPDTTRSQHPCREALSTQLGLTVGALIERARAGLTLHPH